MPRFLPSAAGRRAAAAAGLALLVATGCGTPPRTPVAVVLISIDTLRADRLGAYGYERPTSPHLDALAADGVTFTRSIAAAPSTLPSHASILTGLRVAHHGASFSLRRALPPRVETLAERLRAAGWRTASFNDGGQIEAVWGLGQGFEVYRSLGDDRFAPVVAAGLGWLDRVRAETPRAPLFLFLHTYEVHHPYTPGAADLAALGAAPYHGWLGRGVKVRALQRINRDHLPLSIADLDFLRDTYDAEIHSMDRALGTLIAGLQRRGLYRDALIVFTSDHGEEFGEHGWFGWHSHTLYDELLRVPLVLKLPGGAAAGRRVDAEVRGVDVAPTVLAAAGLGPGAAMDGRSVLPLLDRPPRHRRFAVAELDGGDGRALRGRRWKLYDDRLFDLRTDPGEQFDVAAEHPEIAAELRRRLERAVAGTAHGAPVPEVPLPPERARRLRALGYAD